MVSVCLARNVGPRAENEVIQGSSDPKPCCLPDSWTVDVWQVTGTEQKGHSGISETMLTAYQDVPKNLTAYNQTTVASGVTYHVGEVIDYNKGVLYYFIPAQKYCVKAAVKDKQVNCIPDDSKYQGSRRLGAGSATLMVDSWKIRLLLRGLYFQGNIHVTQEGCIPVSETLTGRMLGVDLMLSQVYSGFTEGVKDKGVFDVPDYCHGADTEGGPDLERSPVGKRPKLIFS